jgi:hypothetical protein
MGLRSGGAAHDAASELIAQPMVSCTDFPMRDSISTRVVSVPIPEPAGGRVITRFAEGAGLSCPKSCTVFGHLPYYVRRNKLAV